MEYKKHRDRIVWHWLSTVFIFLPFIPMVILDLAVEIFHRICFPIYKIDLINRSDYIIYDRQKLSYLPYYDKIYCTYCAYANGVFLYWAAIAAATEKYWCAIKHRDVKVKAMMEQEKGYLEFGDIEGFQNIKKRL